MPAAHLITGREGEDTAARYLLDKGYVILDRNWRYGSLELDIVCNDPREDPPTIVFVEVRTRDARGRATPAQSVNSCKISRLSRAAGLYLSDKDLWHLPCRFDMLCITKHNRNYTVEHFPNAFEYARSLGGGDTAWQPW